MDQTSPSTFVDQAKALIDQGDHARAIEVCQGGLAEDAASVAGRVLFGKALINLGRPAEAMEQFDQAIAIDRDNPYAYNLIGEVLVEKSLYRSALPILRKAAALQPQEPGVKLWLEQTQLALSGGPKPRVEELPPLPAAPPAADVEAPSMPTEIHPAFVERPIRTLELERETTERSEFPPTGDAATPPAPEDDERGETLELPVAPAPDAVLPPPGPPGVEPTVIPSPELLVDAPQGGGGLLDEVPPPPEDDALESAPPQLPPRSSGARPLLEDVPEAEPVPPPRPAPAQVSPREAEKIAHAYEQELRQKLAQQVAQKTFLQRHGRKLAVATVLGLALAAFVGIYAFTRYKNRGRDLKDTLADAKKLIAQDTEASYRAAVASAEHAISMDENSDEAWVLTAYARAILFAEHGGKAEDRDKGLSALSRPQVRERFPGLALASDYYLADAKERAERRKAEVFASALDQTEVHEVAGRILLASNRQDDGRDRLSRAVQLLPGNVRALVALGNYYLSAGDNEKALELFSGAAAQLSPLHPERVVGAAEARFALQREPAEALRELEALPSTPLEPALAERKERVHGLALAAAGRHADAISRLTAALAKSGGKSFELQRALGQALRSAGQLEGAQRAFEAALKLRPKSEEAREDLARALLARDRERDLLARFNNEGDARKVALFRGIAHARLQDWKKARAELQRTAVAGKVPAEAALYLALADAAEGEPEKARGVLEKAVAASKRARSELRVALGQVYWKQGALDKAKVQFDEAAKDPADYEGACSLGRLLLALKLPELAMKPLADAVARNGSHGEARHALVRTALSLGRVADAVTHAAARVEDNPSDPEAQADLAFALLQAGKVNEAEQASARALKLDGQRAATQRERAMILFARGDAKSAFAALERANKLDPKDPETFCQIGLGFLRQGNGSTAEQAFGAAVRESEASACGHVGQVAARLPAGAKSGLKALAEKKKLAQTVWERSFAAATEARAHLVLGELKDARKAADEAVAQDPASGWAHLALGLVALKQRDDEAARAALAKAAELEPVAAPAQLAYADSLVRGGEAELPRAVQAYEAFLRSGGSGSDASRVQKLLPALRKKLAQR